jgi:hypothetical protein
MISRARSIAFAAITKAGRSLKAAGKFTRRSAVGMGEQTKFAAIVVVKWLRKLLTAGVAFGRLLGRSIVRGINFRSLRLIAAVVLFVGWMSYLGYAALTKSRSPIVSHAQAAAASLAIVAEVEAAQDGKPSMRAKVVESLTPNGPQPGTELLVSNLSEVRGFDGVGQYLLLLKPDSPFARDMGNPEDLSSYAVVGQQRSPGNDLMGVGKPAIYRWNDDVRKQYEKLHR